MYNNQNKNLLVFIRHCSLFDFFLVIIFHDLYTKIIYQSSFLLPNSFLTSYDLIYVEVFWYWKICLPINLNIYNIYKTSFLIRSEMFKGDKNVAIGQFINLLHGYLKTQNFSNNSHWMTCISYEILNKINLNKQCSSFWYFRNKHIKSVWKSPTNWRKHTLL